MEKLKKKRATLLAREEKGGRKGASGGGGEDLNGHFSDSSPNHPLDISLHPDFDLLSLAGFHLFGYSFLIDFL